MKHLKSLITVAALSALILIPMTASAKTIPHHDAGQGRDPNRRTRVQGRHTHRSVRGQALRQSRLHARVQCVHEQHAGS
jgi:hypothetical protein